MNCIYESHCTLSMKKMSTGGCTSVNECPLFNYGYSYGNCSSPEEFFDQVHTKSKEKCVKFVRSYNDFKSVDDKLNDYLESNPNLRVKTISYSSNFESTLKFMEVLVVVFEEVLWFKGDET